MEGRAGQHARLVRGIARQDARAASRRAYTVDSPGCLLQQALLAASTELGRLWKTARGKGHSACKRAHCHAQPAPATSSCRNQFKVQGNKLVGTLPPGLGQLKLLEWLRVFGEQAPNAIYPSHISCWWLAVGNLHPPVAPEGKLFASFVCRVCA